MTRQRWSLLAFAAVLITSLVLALAPTGTSTSCSTTPTGPEACTTTHESLLEHEGSSVLLVLAIPVILAAVPLVWRRRRAAKVAAVVLSVFVVLGAASIGMLFLPALVVAWIAASRAGPD